MDGGVWWAAVHGVAKSRKRLSDFTFTFHFHALEKEMATHSSILAWRIPETGEPGGLPSMGSHRVGCYWSDLAAAAAAAVGRITVFLFSWVASVLCTWWGNLPARMNRLEVHSTSKAKDIWCVSCWNVEHKEPSWKFSLYSSGRFNNWEPKELTWICDTTMNLESG